MLKFVKQFALVGGAVMSLLALNAPAQADIIPQLNSLPTPVGSEFLWEYNADVTIGQFVDAGDFFTIYDFAGYVPGSEITPAGWSFSSALVGVTPTGLILTDNAGLPNLTWTRTSDTDIVGPADLGIFSARSIYGAQTLTNYSAMGHKNHPDFIDHGRPTMNKGEIIAPAVPEPGTMALLGLGAAPLLRRLRRRSRKA
jgi:hypothetical protein